MYIPTITVFPNTVYSTRFWPCTSLTKKLFMLCGFPEFVGATTPELGIGLDCENVYVPAAAVYDDDDDDETL